MMSQDRPSGPQEHRDVFISYTNADRQWAEWIAWQLEEAHYTVYLQDWDLRPVFNVVLEKQSLLSRQTRLIAVLSPSYLDAVENHAEWSVLFQHDPTGTRGLLIPTLVEPSPRERLGFLSVLASIDLIGLDEATARDRLVDGVRQDRAKPAFAPLFPIQHTMPEPPVFPGLPAYWNIPYPRNPYFTGREEVLTKLAEAFKTEQVTALTQPQAISGLGGIGKTQIAVCAASSADIECNERCWN